MPIIALSWLDWNTWDLGLIKRKGLWIVCSLSSSLRSSQVHTLHTNINKFKLTLLMTWANGSSAPSTWRSRGIGYETLQEETHSLGASATQDALDFKYCLMHACGRENRNEDEKQRGWVNFSTNQLLECGAPSLSTKFPWQRYAFISELTEDMRQANSSH